MKHAALFTILALAFAALSDICPWPHTATALEALAIPAGACAVLRTIVWLGTEMPFEGEKE